MSRMNARETQHNCTVQTTKNDEEKKGKIQSQGAETRQMVRVVTQ